MPSKRASGRACWVMSACVLLGTAAVAEVAPRLTALASLQPGLWQIRAEGEPQRNICVMDGDALVQLRHGPAMCPRLIVANEKARTTIQYSCPGAGWGRTTIRVATPRLASIDTQGIADRQPFAFVAEARRIGDCGQSPAR